MIRTFAAGAAGRFAPPELAAAGLERVPKQLLPLEVALREQRATRQTAEAVDGDEATPTIAVALAELGYFERSVLALGACAGLGDQAIAEVFGVEVAVIAQAGNDARRMVTSRVPAIASDGIDEEIRVAFAPAEDGPDIDHLRWYRRRMQWRAVAGAAVLLASVAVLALGLSFNPNAWAIAIVAIPAAGGLYVCWAGTKAITNQLLQRGPAPSTR